VSYTESEESPKRLRVFIADDHAVVRDGLRLLINSQPDMRVIGEAEDGRQAYEGIKEHQPDVVIMDVSMPDANGIETTVRVLRQWPHVKILALTMHEDRSYLRSLLEAGASGYVLKRSAAEELIRAIRTVAAGSAYIDPTLTATMVQSLMRKPGQLLPKGEMAGQSLSERERQVLEFIAQGYTNKEIGVKLAISEKTVETYKVRSMKKLELDSRADVVRYALQHGWFQHSAVV
jgi:two-component system, NarL family, response regulator NreC